MENNDGQLPLFDPDSTLRKVVGEAGGLFGGGRALLLQLAHPMVAAGVAEHSNFREAPLVRLHGTLDMMLALCFGTHAGARDVLHDFHGVHRPIKGTLPEAAGPFAAGTPYTASDPALKMWVQATLIDSSMLSYEWFVAPLTPGERDAFYADAKVFARRLGIPPALIPPTLPAFRRYMAEMYASDILTVTPTARALAEAVLHPAVGPIPRMGISVARFATPGLLPSRLRRAYGLPWDARRQVGLVLLGRTLRLLHPALPRTIRLMPQAGGGRMVQWVLDAARKTS